MDRLRLRHDARKRFSAGGRTPLDMPSWKAGEFMKLAGEVACVRCCPVLQVESPGLPAKGNGKPARAMRWDARGCETVLNATMLAVGDEASRSGAEVLLVAVPLDGI